MQDLECFEYEPVNKMVGVVLVGNFNPLMFHPQWFGWNEVISESEANAAVTSNAPCIIAPNITVFNTSQLQIQVRETTFSVTATKESFSIVKDVVKKTFERLGSMSIRAMGINTSAHFKMPNVSKYHEFGDKLSPKDIWKELLGDSVFGDNRTGGLARMQMYNKKDEKVGSLNITVESSVKFIHSIFVNCNDHYDFEECTDAETVMAKLEENFDSSIQKSTNIQKSLFKDL
jgi:hypothetical protein